MLKTKLNFLLIGIVILLTSVILVVGNPTQTTDSLVRGQFEGIRFNYGIADYNDSGSHSDRMSLNNSENWDSTSSYRTRIRISLSRGNTSATYYSMFTDDPQFGDFEKDPAIGNVDYIKELVVYESNSSLVPNGTFSILDFIAELNETGTSFGYSEPSVVSIPVYTYSTNDYVDYTVAPVIYIRLDNSKLNSDSNYFYEFYPSHQIVSGIFNLLPVNVTTRSFGFYESTGYYQFEYTYKVSGKKAEVNIFDDGSLSVKYEAFLENDLEYTETGSYYNLINSEYNSESYFTIIGDHTFTVNGTIYSFTDGQFLPTEFLFNPDSYNSSYSYKGYTNSSWVIDGRIQSISAAQSITQILTPLSLNQKIVWQNSFPAVLQAFTKQSSGEKLDSVGSVIPVGDDPSNDVVISDSNEAASLNFSPDSNKVSYDNDVVLGHTGYLEAYQYDYSYTGTYDSNSTYSNKVDSDFTTGMVMGNDVTKPGQDVSGTGSNSYSYEYSYNMGNIDQEYKANLVWLDPVRSNGKISFAWVLELTDFPTSWFLNYFENQNAPMDLSFGYIYEIDVDDATSVADTSLSLTFEYGELAPTIKPFMEGFSLATSSYTQWIVKKDVEVQNTLLNSVSKVADQVEFSAVGRSIGDIEFGNAKKIYSLFTPDGEFRYEIVTSIMALHYYSDMNGVDSQFSTEEQSKIETVTQEKMNSVYLMDAASDIIPDFRVRSFIIMITYPEWSGNKIIHDPTYSSISEIKKYPGENYVSTGIIVTTVPSIQSTPGFQVLLIGIGILFLVFNKRRK
ncbi:MAG: hypothetical protein HeimC3_21540 [Candidatus Heimdallarchaeota archaeon LC_3]|nr:MAG: hypothetical protein HeimC3_21540 [Candidatus Heimdallarchaeota archaeon LC_3]